MPKQPLTKGRTRAKFDLCQLQRSPDFRYGHRVDIVGVTGSIPVTPTILFKGLARNRQALFDFGLDALDSVFNAEAVLSTAGPAALAG